MAVITRWSYKRGGRKAGFHCRPFHWYGGLIELIRFKEYYGMPRGGGGGHLLSIYVRFLMPVYQIVLMPPGHPIILLK